MKTTTRTLPARILARCFRFGSATQTEANVASTFADVPEDVLDLAIDELMDAGLLRSTVIDCGEATAHCPRFVAALTTLPLVAAA